MSGIFKIIILLGALQGIIIGFLLFFSRQQRQSNRLLAVLIWLMALCSLNLYLGLTGLFYINKITSLLEAFVPIEIVMPMGPLLFFYIQSSLDPHFKLRKQQRKHFYPVILDLLPKLAAVVYVTGILTGLIKKAIPMGYYIDVYYNYVDIPRWLSITVYTWLAAKHLSSFRKLQSGEQTPHTKWLHQFIRVFQVFQVIWFIYLVPYVIPRYSNWLLDTFDWYPIYIPLAVLIYWLGIKGYLVSQANVAAGRKKNVLYDRLPADAVEQAAVTLITSMEKDKLYLNSSLSLALVSEHTGIAQKTISAVLNQHLHKSFNEFINEYRIAAFKQKMTEPGLSHLTITGIALECGFNSQATFQRTFKQFTGMSPSAFRDSLPISGNE